ncbi:MAG: polysaccharide biosynthesis protein [Chloroflexi bacterium]|nr:polysaccharide biosynthesis protein [Chloroflexota bacterium]
MNKEILEEFFRKKRVLISGGTGSIGSELVRKVLQYNPEVVRVFSRDESKQFELQQELQGHKNIRFLIGDVRDKERLKRAMEDINLVFHAAALKHVPACEYNPFEAVKTNVLGTQNVIEAALDQEIEKMITISTDKATSPISVMGATKLLAERLTISANYYKGKRKTIFSCVRFGNVLDSRGSVVPVFRKQISQGGPVTITDPAMTRFVISIPKAIDLVLKAAIQARGGEIFILKMPILSIGDLAQAMIEEIAPKNGYAPKEINVKIIGKRPGERAFEELMSENEAMSAYETEDMFVVLNQASNGRLREQKPIRKGYSSGDEPLLTKEEIKDLLKENL